jgi:hypothetical protein
LGLDVISCAKKKLKLVPQISVESRTRLRATQVENGLFPEEIRCQTLRTMPNGIRAFFDQLPQLSDEFAARQYWHRWL